MNAKNQNVVPITESHDAMTPMTLLNQAVANGNIELAEKLMGLQERWEKNQARKAFDGAMAAAKAELPVILKSREVDFTSARGRTNYRYEDMAQIAQQVDPVLTKHGLTYRFRTETEGNNVKVTCIISHRDGHSEENSLSAARDESGNKNSIQAVGSTITYLQRYSLKAALGLSASVDDDGRGASGNGGGDKITADQVNVLSAAVDEVGADEIKFCKYLKVESLADLPASRFDDAMAALAQKHRKGSKA